MANPHERVAEAVSTGTIDWSPTVYTAEDSDEIATAAIEALRQGVSRQQLHEILNTWQAGEWSATDTIDELLNAILGPAKVGE